MVPREAELAVLEVAAFLIGVAEVCWVVEGGTPAAVCFGVGG